MLLEAISKIVDHIQEPRSLAGLRICFLKVLSKRGPIRRRPNQRAMAGQAQKRSPASGGISVYFKEAHDAPWSNKIDANPASRGNAGIGRRMHF